MWRPPALTTPPVLGRPRRPVERGRKTEPPPRFTAGETDGMLISSLVGFAISWGLMEPIWIVLITLLPCLCDTKLANWMNDRANDIGIDLSLVIG